MRGGSGGGNRPRGMLGSLSLEDLPLNRVLIVRNDLHHPLTLVRGGCGGTRLDQHEGHDCDRRWRTWKGIGRSLGWWSCWYCCGLRLGVRRRWRYGRGCGRRRQDLILGLQHLDQSQPSLPIHLRIYTDKTNIAEVRHRLKLKYKEADQSCIKQESNENKGQKVMRKDIPTYISC